MLASSAAICVIAAETETPRPPRENSRIVTGAALEYNSPAVLAGPCT